MTKIVVWETVSVAPPPPVDGQAVSYQQDVGPTGGKIAHLEYQTPGGLKIRPQRDLIHTVKNGTGTLITKGQVVYVNGYDSTYDVPTVGLAKADALATMPALGIAAENIAATTGVGRIITQGRISGVVTTGMTVGDRVWVSKATAGAFTNAQPDQPVLEQRLGTVTSVGAAGSITVGVQDALEKGMANGVLGLDAGGNPYGLGTKVKTADQATVSTHTTLANDTHLTWPIVAGASYTLDVVYFCLPGALTTGAKVALNGPAIGTGYIRYGMIVPISATTINHSAATAYETALLSTDFVSTSVPTVLRFNAFVANGANAGNLVMRIAAEANAVLTYQRGSYGILTRVA